MLAAGLFEYNFGDSEFLMLFLVLVHAAVRRGTAGARRRRRNSHVDHRRVRLRTRSTSSTGSPGSLLTRDA